MTVDLDHPLVRAADQLAERAHAGQVRKGSLELYVEHPRRVAARVARCPWATPEVVAAALLHDAFEDTAVGVGEVTIVLHEACMPTTVVELVLHLTDRYTKGAHPGLSRAARKALEAARLYHAPWRARALKLADLADNLRSPPLDTGFREVYLAEADVLVQLLGSADASIEREAVDALRSARDAP